MQLKSAFCLPVIWLSVICTLSAQSQTVGLFNYQQEAWEGYTLFAPLRGTSAYLIDNCGRLVNEWENDRVPGNTVILLENGQLLRTERISNPVMQVGGSGGRIEMVDWDGNITWEFVYSDSMVLHHHEALQLPNGNILLLAIERRSLNEAFSLGRNPAITGASEFWPEQIVEIEPVGSDSGTVVWKWNIWDHLVQDYDSTLPNYGSIADHPELLDINFTFSANSEDWLHANAIDYNPELDQIILNSRNTNEFYIIDHSTSTAEAAGHEGGTYGKGGDILYRWGNPEIYGRGTSADQMLFAQHHAHWIDAGLPNEGKILIFNNGTNRPDSGYASVDRIDPPQDSAGFYSDPGMNAFGPVMAEWSLPVNVPEIHIAGFLSSSQQLPNGNMLIGHGPNGIFWEVDSNGQEVWRYWSPVGSGPPLSQGDSVPSASATSLDNRIFRIIRYGTDFPGFAGKDLTPGDRIEQNPDSLPAICAATSLSAFDLPPIRIYPNPAPDKLILEYPADPELWYDILNLQGKILFRGKYDDSQGIQTRHLAPGIYLIRVRDSHNSVPIVEKFIKP